VAASLILYPRYLDPVTRLECPPEVLVERLAADVKRDRTGAERVTRLARISVARALYLGQSVKDLARRNV
jgi:capsule polysaccharide export protein KpsC/LpsZ